MCTGIIDEIQPVKAPWPLIMLVLNIIIPGTGTMMNACMGERFSCTSILVGLLQLLLSYILIGWVWSIWWGILIIEKAGYH